MEPHMAITRYSVDDYEEMVRLGALTKRDRVVLIRGEIVPRTTVEPKQASYVRRLNTLLVQRAGETAIVGCRSPVRLPDSVPEPDVSVLRPRADFYASGHPRPADVFLIAQVADSSLDDDRELMRPLYAESGILEYWIVNLVDEQLEVHRGPRPDGTYADTRIVKRGESTGIAALPGLVVAVDELL